MTEQQALIILNAIYGLGPRRIIKLIEHFKHAQHILAASFKQLSQSLVLPENIVQNILDFPKEAFLKRELMLLERHHTQVVTIFDENYPAPLRYIHDAPVVLYVRGRLCDDWQNALAIVGSRQASVYGIMMAQKFAQELAQQGLLIVSGLAKGIDRAAHEGSLSVGQPTVAVLGCGLSHIYPPEHLALYGSIENNGAIISEFPMETQPLAHNFPRRNRIISGLSKGVLVIEAAVRSGALITADFALEQGKEVYAIPGPIDKPNSLGVLELIKQGAKLVTSAADIVEDFAVPQINQPADEKGQVQTLNLTEEERRVYEALDARPRHVDELTQLLGKPCSGVAGILLSLELKHCIQQHPGKFFSKI